MLGAHSDGTKDTFLYMQPEFETLDACRNYVYIQAPIIKQQMMIEYQGNGIETIYCIQKDKIEKYLDITNKDQLET
jgi:hypothetical protein